MFMELDTQTKEHIKKLKIQLHHAKHVKKKFSKDEGIVRTMDVLIKDLVDKLK